MAKDGTISVDGENDDTENQTCGNDVHLAMGTGILPANSAVRQMLRAPSCASRVRNLYSLPLLFQELLRASKQDRRGPTSPNTYDC